MPNDPKLIEVMARAIYDCPDGDDYDKAQAALDAIAEAGYAVVPVEPTEAMEDAGSEAYWDMRGGTPAPNNKNSIGELIVCAYKAMLAAALAGRKP